ncbi:MAG: hypothetical protein QN209_00885, partial [Armatimonadota bacterium]|nr:hypothetical protein [Armatimonadota bacterium]
PTAAILDLRAATQLDPASPEPWRELGEAQAALGVRSESIASFEAAVARGLREPRALELLGRASQERGDLSAAARFFAHALWAQPAATDPGLPVVILVGLGRTLLQMESLQASREALAQGLEGLNRVPGLTRYGAELGFIVRRQAELWRDVGDAAARLSRLDEALDAYRRASALPAVEDLSLAPRFVYAALRSGRPALAALFLLDRIEAAGGVVDDADLPLLPLLQADPTTAQALASALAFYRDSLPPEAPVGVRGGLARAQAALLSSEEARRVLLDHLRHYPSDLAGMARLFAASSRPAIDAADMVTAHPLMASRVAHALYRARDDLPALQSALAVPSLRPAGGILVVELELRRSRPRMAVAATESLASSSRLAHAVALAVEAPPVHERVCNAADTGQFTVRQIIDAVAAILDHRWEVIDLPEGLLPPHRPSQALPYCIDPYHIQPHLLLDTTRLRAELGYTDVVSPEAALEATVRWLAGRPDAVRAAAPLDYAAIDAAVAAARRGA